ncbi:MAG TPA: hypothetical protein VFU99_10090 [Gaiellaceae bacterium]|nr:hypothetical protein [Gaiellaceae bacterium]
MKLVAPIAVLTGLVLALASPAAATSIQISGEQTAVDADLGIYEMAGSLVGDWYTTSFECNSTPAGERWPCTGTELFVGCLDSSADGTCSQEESGWLEFEFEFTASASGNGRCHHTIIDGGDAFDGATGVITMKDRPTEAGLVTTYKGHIAFSDPEASAGGRRPDSSSATTVSQLC